MLRRERTHGSSQGSGRRLSGVVGALALAGIAFCGTADGQQQGRLGEQATAQLDQIYSNAMAAGSGGTFGYYLKQTKGPVLAARNDGYVYDPASALKALLLVDALRHVADGSDALSNPVTVYTYPQSRNANGDPVSPNLCPDPADEVPANFVNPAPTLQAVLQGMMQVSNNRYTRAIELRYGRDSVNGLAQALGMTNTSQNQIFGCGSDNNQHNVWTLDDAGKLYEAIAAGTALNPTETQTLNQIMLTLPFGFSSPQFDSIVQQEASSLGLDVQAEASVASGMTIRSKGGSYDICFGSCATDDVVDRDQAGIVTLPTQTPTRPSTQSYAWGSFIADETASCPAFPCAAADAANTAVGAAVPELLRPAIHAALATWVAKTTISAGTGILKGRKLTLSARLSRTFSASRPAGVTISFVVGGHTICRARTNASGTAQCSGITRSRPKTYAARFAGTSSLFASSAIGPVRARSH
jgi:hypothetical protein